MTPLLNKLLAYLIKFYYLSKPWQRFDQETADFSQGKA